MRIFSVLIAIAILGLLAGCVSYHGLDAPPGGLVIRVSGPQGLSSWSDFFQRVRIIAPPGARLCRVAYFENAGGSDRSGAPNANGEVMLTLDYNAQQIGAERIICEMGDGGVIERDARRIRIGETPYRRNMAPFVHVSFPPLLHMAPGDPHAVERWSSVRAEICTAPQDDLFARICGAEAWRALQAADLGEPS
jgi:hypothetical protein